MKKVAKELQFKVIIEQDEDRWYVASVPTLPGCYTQGKTIEQVRNRIKEVIELVLESDNQLANEYETLSSQTHFLGIDEVTVRRYA